MDTHSRFLIEGKRQDRGSDYFGQPLGGFFFSSERLTGARHSPFGLSLSAFGPGVTAALVPFCLSFFVTFGLKILCIEFQQNQERRCSVA